MGKIQALLIGIILCTAGTVAGQHNSTVRQNLVKVYESKIGVRELTGRNDGPAVEEFLKYVWLKPGNPWCAAFVSWSFGQVGIKKARSGGCVQLMEQGKTIYSSGRIIQQPQFGDVFFIWFAEKKRVAHTGFIHQWTNEWITTVEGNTNESGSREGDGVYKKKRLRRQIYAVTTYIN